MRISDWSSDVCSSDLSFTVPADWRGENVMLNFGAVDYETTVRVNGSVVGSHKGGFDAFGFDITPYLKAGENELIVEVLDRSEERRVGKEGVSTCRSGGSPDH